MCEISNLLSVNLSYLFKDLNKSCLKICVCMCTCVPMCAHVCPCVCPCVHVCVCKCAPAPQHTCKGQKTTLWSRLSLHSYELRLSGLHGKHPDPLSHLTLTKISSHFPPMSCDITFCPGPWLSPHLPWPSCRLASPCDEHSPATHTLPRPQLLCASRVNFCLPP